MGIVSQRRDHGKRDQRIESRSTVISFNIRGNIPVAKSPDISAVGPQDRFCICFKVHEDDGGFGLVITIDPVVDA
jgi:hypothetical protein